MSEHVILDGALKTKMGSTDSKEVVKVSYRKVVKVSEYETETIDLESSVELDWKLTGIERMLVTHLLSSELEYSVLLQLCNRGLVNITYLNRTLERNELTAKLLIEKAREIVPDFDENKYSCFEAM